MMQHSTQLFRLDTSTRREICVRLRRQFVLLCGIAILQAACGQMAIMYHMHAMLKEVGFADDTSDSAHTAFHDTIGSFGNEGMAATTTTTGTVVGWATYVFYGMVFMAAPFAVYTCVFLHFVSHNFCDSPCDVIRRPAQVYLQSPLPSVADDRNECTRCVHVPWRASTGVCKSRRTDVRGRPQVIFFGTDASIVAIRSCLSNGFFEHGPTPPS